MAVLETDYLGNRCHVGYTFLSLVNMDDHGLPMFQDTKTKFCVCFDHSFAVLCFTLKLLFLDNKTIIALSFHSSVFILSTS